MRITEKGPQWERSRSLWITYTWTGFLAGMSFYRIGQLLQNRRWGIKTAVLYTLPALLYFALVPWLGGVGLHLCGMVVVAVVAFLQC
ncbi:hypothetical protein [Paenibacillus ginsengarvi]|uniref:hypothetical protein n=1 Tax=Paenibacillus ginsengarvi TaxID=400777 RepID=UPI00131598B5|nr:hypothetical protein [Paenibacillus ginsengarvi]